MISKHTRKQFRIFKRKLRSKQYVAAVCLAIFFVSAIGYAIYMDNRRLSVDPITYRPILHLIAKVESKDNYNAYFGDPSNTSIDFTEMSIAQVLQWQSEYVHQGSPSDAVGRYQIISTTLRDLVNRLGIDPQQKFDESMQDRLAIALLERRGAERYVNNELPRTEFAANLAKEWAALPRVVGDNPNSSYYASDGLNRALVSVDEVLHSIESISAK